MKRASRAARRALAERIAYKFGDESLLEQALTHISAVKGKGRVGSYQRLEFLGDRVLGLAISEMLFSAFPKADEGELSKRLAELVRQETCAEVARSIDLGEAIELGGPEANAGGRRRTAILADVCEALVGAVFLDGGYPVAAMLVERLWGERLRTRAAGARRQDRIAGMGAGTRAADPALPRSRAQRPASQSGVPHQRRTAEPGARRRRRPLQARRRAGRGGGAARTRRGRVRGRGARGRVDRWM